MIIEKIIPPIFKLSPRVVSSDRNSEEVFIQQDNFGPHVSVDDTAISPASSLVSHLDIKMIVQPTMNLGPNILDMCLFNFR